MQSSRIDGRVTRITPDDKTVQYLIDTKGLPGFTILLKALEKKAVGNLIAEVYVTLDDANSPKDAYFFRDKSWFDQLWAGSYINRYPTHLEYKWVRIDLKVEDDKQLEVVLYQFDQQVEKVGGDLQEDGPRSMEITESQLDGISFDLQQFDEVHIHSTDLNAKDHGKMLESLASCRHVTISKCKIKGPPAEPAPEKKDRYMGDTMQTYTYTYPNPGEGMEYDKALLNVKLLRSSFFRKVVEVTQPDGTLKIKAAPVLSVDEVGELAKIAMQCTVVSPHYRVTHTQSLAYLTPPHNTLAVVEFIENNEFARKEFVFKGGSTRQPDGTNCIKAARTPDSKPGRWISMDTLGDDGDVRKPDGDKTRRWAYSISALRTLGAFDDGEMAVVHFGPDGDTDVEYKYVRFSNAEDDGTHVIKPDGMLPFQKGRWVRVEQHLGTSGNVQIRTGNAVGDGGAISIMAGVAPSLDPAYEYDVRRTVKIEPEQKSVYVYWPGSDFNPHIIDIGALYEEIKKAKPGWGLKDVALEGDTLKIYFPADLPQVEKDVLDKFVWAYKGWANQEYIYIFHIPDDMICDLSYFTRGSAAKLPIKEIHGFADYIKIRATQELTLEQGELLRDTWKNSWRDPLTHDDLDVEKEIALAQKFGPPGHKKGKRLLKALKNPRLWAVLFILAALVGLFGMKTYFAFTPIDPVYSSPLLRSDGESKHQKEAARFSIPPKK